MSLLYFDGFDRYGTAVSSSLYARSGWTVAGNAQNRPTSGRRSGNAAEVWNATIASNYLEHGFTSATTAIVGAAFLSQSGGSWAASPILQLRDSAGSHIELRNDNTGKLGVFKGTGTTTQIGSWTTTGLTQGTWSYLELKVVIGTSGSWELRLDGAVIGSASGDTKGSSASATDRVRLGGLSSSNSAYRNLFDDLYILDDAGSAPFNTYLGDVAVERRGALAQGASNNWRPLLGRNIALNANGTASAISTSGAFAASNAFDGNTATLWRSNTGASVNDWLAFDFGSARNIHGYGLAWQTGSNLERANAYKIQYSTDNTTWTDAYDKTSGADQDVFNVPFTAASARYWRFLCTVDKAAGNPLQITTFELYDADDTETFHQVDEVAADDDVTYADASIAGDTELYTIPSTAVTAGHTLGAVKLCFDVKKDATSSSPTVAPVIRVGTTNYAGTTVATSTSYAVVQEIYAQRPDSTNWVNADVQGGIQIGVKVVAN
jgi:hypothetical protein